MRVLHYEHDIKSWYYEAIAFMKYLPPLFEYCNKKNEQNKTPPSFHMEGEAQGEARQVE